MGLISGSVACTRFTVVAAPEEIDFESVPFRALQRGSILRESTGFVPFGPDEPYQTANRSWAFRIRTDQKKVDVHQLKERVKALVKVEMESVGPPSMKKIQELRKMAEDELLEDQSSTTKIIECVLDDHTLYVGTTAQSQLGSVTAALLKLGIQLDFKTPWIDAGLASESVDHIDYQDAGQSVIGCHYLKWLLSDPVVFPEVDKGLAKLMTPNGTTVSLRGTIHSELERYLDEEAEPLQLKLLFEDTQFTLDGLSFRISGLKVNPYKSQHWMEQLDARMERIKEVWAALDERFALYLASRGGIHEAN
ncbi:MAG: hypothetical protein KDC35_00295 [Acidobacteria bacterium]|nr:hypothetical protein [Acidobacteriota bacterium]